MSGLQIIRGLIFFLAINGNCLGYGNGGNSAPSGTSEGRLRIVAQPANVRGREVSLPAFRLWQPESPR